MRVIICGAGLAGLTLAWWLRKSGWDVVLVDDAEGPRTEGHLVTLDKCGFDVVARMGLIAELRSIEHHITEVTYVGSDGRPRGRLRLPTGVAGRDKPSATVVRSDLEQMLRTALKGLVKTRFGMTVRGVRQTATEVGVVLSDGTRERADLLVGADGLHSRIRRMVFGPEEVTVRPMGYDRAGYLVKDSAIDQELDGRFTVLTAPGRQVGVYPLGGGALATFLAHRSTDRHLPRHAAARLRDVYGGMGWIVDDILSHCPETPFYDQVGQVELDRWSSGRVTLAGDAGLAVPSLTGRNAPLAVASAFALAVALYEERDIRVALRDYETSMRPVVQQHQSIARRTAKWAVPQKSWHLMARDALLTTLGVPGVSRLLSPMSARAARRIAPV